MPSGLFTSCPGSARSRRAHMRDGPCRRPTCRGRRDRDSRRRQARRPHRHRHLHHPRTPGSGRIPHPDRSSRSCRCPVVARPVRLHVRIAAAPSSVDNNGLQGAHPRSPPRPRLAAARLRRRDLLGLERRHSLVCASAAAGAAAAEARSTASMRATNIFIGSNRTRINTTASVPRMRLRARPPGPLPPAPPTRPPGRPRSSPAESADAARLRARRGPRRHRRCGARARRRRPRRRV